MAISYNEKADLYILEDDSANSTILNSNFETKLQGILNKVDEEKGYLKIRVGDEYKYYNFKFEEKKASEVLTSNTLFLSKKDGKYGLKRVARYFTIIRQDRRVKHTINFI